MTDFVPFLLWLFIMRIVFVAIGCEQLGISLLSALAKQKGHDVSLAFSLALFDDLMHVSIPALGRFFSDRKIIFATIKKNQPDVIVFSPASGSYRWMLEVAAEAKKICPHSRVIFGGPHVSAVPELVISQPAVDYVCIGEGDIAFLKMLEALEKEDFFSPIENTWYKNSRGQIIKGPQVGFIQDLDSLPMFDKPLWEDYFNFSDHYMTMATRGCPFRCTFCFNNYYANLPQGEKGQYMRYRSVDHFMHELRWAMKRYRVKRFDFFDDIFTYDKKWLKNFLDQYKRDIKRPFEIFSHLVHLDEATMKMLGEAGCFSVELGIQTLDDAYKKRVLKRFDSHEKLIQVIRWSKQCGVRVRADHMLGLPTEPIEAQEAARQFYVENTPYRIHTYWVKFFPGTELQKQALDMGVLTKKDIEKLNSGHDVFCIKHSETITDPQRLRNYQVYQLIFRLITYMPARIKRLIKPRLFRFCPTGLVVFLTFWVDLSIGLVLREAHHYIYLKFYFFHMYCLLRTKVGLKRIPRMRHLNPETDLSFQNNCPSQLLSGQ